MSDPSAHNRNPPHSAVVGVASSMILSPVLHKLFGLIIPLWSAGLTLTPGDYITAPNGRRYWCIVGGTTTATPTVPDDPLLDVVDGAIVLRPVTLSRRSLSIANIGETRVCLARGYAAVLHAGIVLEPGAVHNEGYAHKTLAYPGAWYAISSDVGGALAIAEG